MYVYPYVIGEYQILPLDKQNSFLKDPIIAWQPGEENISHI